MWVIEYFNLNIIILVRVDLLCNLCYVFRIIQWRFFGLILLVQKHTLLDISILILYVLYMYCQIDQGYNSFISHLSVDKITILHFPKSYDIRFCHYSTQLFVILNHFLLSLSSNYSYLELQISLGILYLKFVNQKTTRAIIESKKRRAQNKCCPILLGKQPVSLMLPFKKRNKSKISK